MVVVRAFCTRETEFNLISEWQNTQKNVLIKKSNRGGGHKMKGKEKPLSFIILLSFVEAVVWQEKEKRSLRWTNSLLRSELIITLHEGSKNNISTFLHIKSIR